MSGGPHFLGEAMLDQREVRADVVDVRAPGVLAGAVTRPTLPVLALEGVPDQGADRNPVGPGERGWK